MQSCLSLRSVLGLSLYLNFPLTYWLAGGDDIVNELHLLSRQNNRVDTLPLNEDRVTFDPAMTGQEGLELRVR